MGHGSRSERLFGQTGGHGVRLAIDLPCCCWFGVSFAPFGHINPLVQPPANDLTKYRLGRIDEHTSFLRRRIAGALQRGSDHLWGRRRKADLIAAEFVTAGTAQDLKLAARVAEHFRVRIVMRPVICLHVEPAVPVVFHYIDAMTDVSPAGRASTVIGYEATRY